MMRLRDLKIVLIISKIDAKYMVDKAHVQSYREYIVGSDSRHRAESRSRCVNWFRLGGTIFSCFRSRRRSRSRNSYSYRSNIEEAAAATGTMH